MAQRSRLASSAVLALLVLGLASGRATAGPRDPLYEWTDADGVVRYTSEPERIPLGLRADAVEVKLPPEPEPAIPHLEGRMPQADSRPAEDGALPAVESPAPATDATDATPSSLDLRIEALEREIAADEATLTEHISDPERAARLQSSDEVTAIAERLPRLQAELRALREQRDAAARDVP